MPFFIPAIMAGVSALGGLLGNRKKEVQQSGTADTSFNNVSSSNATALQMPEYDPYTMALRNLIGSMYQGRASEDTDLSGYTATGLGNINRSAELRKKAAQQMLAARGLSYSPVAATSMNAIDSDRFGQTVEFRNQIPLLADQLRGQKINDLAGFFARLPVGTSTATSSTGTTAGTQHTSSTGNVQYPSNMLGGAFNDAASMLAYLYGRGAFSNSNPSVKV